MGKTGSFFDALSDGWILIDMVEELKKSYQTGNWMDAYQNIGLKMFKKIVKEGNKYLDKKNNLKYLGVDKQLQSVLINTLIKMPEKWINGIKDYGDDKGTAGTIIVDMAFGSFFESVANAVEPYYKAGTAAVYPLIDELCETVGYNLSGEYERLTGKKGLDAVFSAQKELWVDTVYKGVMDMLGEDFDEFYEAVETTGKWIGNTVQSGWKNWTSGMKRIFGG